ncbi:MAG: MBOAT family protein [Clostridiales bacterium]|nr:MBOAT family protein [Clostridiales bacterium]
MLFSSIPFLYTFLPCVLIVYFLVPNCLKNAVLLLSSLFFYAWGEPRFVVFMVIAIIQGYVFGLLAETYRGRPQAKLCLYASAAVSLGLLGYCKYADFFIGSFNSLTGLSLPLLHVALPIGISFYTFQILSYVIDVYRGNAAAQRNFIDLAAYVAMFPQLIAGPIVRYTDIAPQLKHRTHTLSDAAYGARRFIIGLSKKVLLANVLYELISAYKDGAETSVLFTWLYAAAYILHLYFDFSGYSDMAIGLGRIFGFYFPENFNYPYISASVTEFWRRWHMSLGSWFRDYVYIPLGGNRVSRGKWFRNIFIVWLLTGLWHGAAWTFILWGLFFALFLTAEKLWYGQALARTKLLKHVYVLLLIVVSFVLFDAASVQDALRTIAALFGLGGLPLADALSRYYLWSYTGVFLIAAVGATPLPVKILRQLKENRTGSIIVSVLEPLVLLALLAAVTAYLVDGSFNPFLYFRF